MDPAVVEYLSQKGLLSGGALTPPDVAPLSAPSPSPSGLDPSQRSALGVGDGSPSPTPSASGIDPQVISYITSRMQYPPGLDLQGLREAQQADRDRMAVQALGQAGERAAATIQNRAPNFEGLTPDQLNVRNFVAQRQLAGEEMQRAVQMGMMPFTLRKTMAETATAEAEAPKRKAETQATLAGIPKTQAEARLANANAKGAELENGPAPDSMLALGKQYGLDLPADTTTKQAREMVDAAAKRQGLQVDWGKLGLDKQRVDLEGTKVALEEKHYQSDHPWEPVSGYRYVGPGEAPKRDSEEVKTLGDKVAAANDLKKTLGEMRDIYDRQATTGRLTGADSQRLDTLHGSLSGQIGRAASGGKLAEYDVQLAHDQLPRPSSIKGALRPDLIHAAIDTLTQHADQGHREYARAKLFAPTAEAAQAANSRLVSAGVADPAQRRALLREMGY